MTHNCKIFMGIDVSKDTLDISVNGKHSKIANTKPAINTFVKTKIAVSDITLCVLESTGGYEKLAITLLNEAGIKVHRAHPNKVYAFAKASGHFAKTDKLDSKLLEKYAEFIEDKDLPCIELTDNLSTLQDLRSVQRDLEGRLHSQQCRAKLLKGKSLEYTSRQIDFINQQLVQIAKDIDSLVSNDDELQKKQTILTSYKGVGKKIANSLIAEMPELGTLSNKEVASLTGVAPKTNESGKKVAKGHISGGRFFVRKVLYMSALVAMRYNCKMRDLYERLVASGKPAKIALTAIMRKIIICLNAMIRNNKLYEI